MIKPMYRLNPELGRYEKLYLYGDHQAEENMKRSCRGRESRLWAVSKKAARSH